MLAALVEGEVAAAERAALEAHMAACGRCQDVLAAMDLDAPGLGRLPRTPRPPGSRSPGCGAATCTG